MDILKSFIFGLTLAISIGPIAILIIHYGINFGKRISILSGLGAAFADLTYSLLGFAFGYNLISILQGNQKLLKTASSLVLIGFGIYMIISSLKKGNRKEKIKTYSKPTNALWTTYILTIINPLTILLFVAFAGNAQTASIGDIFANSISVFIGSLTIQIALATFGAYLGKYITNIKTIRILNIASGIGILIFGCSNFF
jgi:threonine/homoserine/homoserine lactone efflux protein